MKTQLTVLLFLFLFGNVLAQEKLDYQNPPAAILELVEAPMAPAVRIDSKGENVILFYRDPYKSILELSETELRLGGLRINPKTNIGSRTTYYNNLKVKQAKERDPRQVSGMPNNARLDRKSVV